MVNKDLVLLPIDKIADKYGHRCEQETAVSCYVSRIFNEKYGFVSKPRIFRTLGLAKPDNQEQHYLDLTDLTDRLSVPDGYIVEVLAMAFVYRGKEISIFPFETKIDAASEMLQQVKEELETFKEIGSTFEAFSFLKDIGLKNIAKELSEGNSRFAQGDYDASIKAYRKVVEGFRNFLQAKTSGGGEKKVYRTLIDQSASRTEHIVTFLSKMYSLLSNFGEHYGTYAFDEEGVLARKLVESISEYLAKKLGEKD